MQGLNDQIQDPHLLRALELMSAQDLDAAEAELNTGLAEAKDDAVLSALFYSTLGVLSKIRKDFRQAWRYYEKAEQLLPEDPSLKLISAQLLMEVFGQYDTTIRRCEKVLTLAPHDPIFYHQAYITIGLAQLKRGERHESVRCLVEAMRDNFEGLGSAGMIDLKLLEALLRKKLGLEEGRQYLEAALNLAQETKEEELQHLFTQLLEAFPEAET